MSMALLRFTREQLCVPRDFTLKVCLYAATKQKNTRDTTSLALDCLLLGPTTAPGEELCDGGPSCRQPSECERPWRAP